MRSESQHPNAHVCPSDQARKLGIWLAQGLRGTLGEAGPAHREARPKRNEGDAVWAALRGGDAAASANQFPLLPESRLSFEKEKPEERKSTRAFVLLFRLFASQLKSGCLGDRSAVFTV
jgi:hypothetical protein